MSDTKSAKPFIVDKSTWGDGPWQAEPDHVDWRDTETNYPCIAHRNEAGAWCGYVGLPPGHPARSGNNYDNVDNEVEVHGGITYGAKCFGVICHVPEPGESDDVFWYGFDCNHYLDRAPGSEAFFRKIGHQRRADDPAVYRDLAYVQAECGKLARQFKAMEAAPCGSAGR